MTDEEILKVWLSGTTCSAWRVKKSILLSNDTHIVLKHNAHSEYVGRTHLNSLNCEAYARLYLKSNFVGKDYTRIGDGQLHEWRGGRISVVRIVEECKEMGIIFERKKRGE